MKILHQLNIAAAMLGYLAVLCLVGGGIILARSGYEITFEPSLDESECMRTVERSDQPTQYYPSDVFAERKPPQWSPGNPLPLDANQAIQIATNTVLKDHPEYAKRAWLAQSIALHHATDGNWYYEYSAWVRADSGQPADHVSLSVLMDGSIWIPKEK